MKPFDYIRARTLDGAIGLLAHAEGDGLRPLAGGTDLLPLMKAEVAAPAGLVNIKEIAALTGIEETPQGLLLGALTTLAQIEASPLLRERAPALTEAAALAATPQLRNMATLGGNLLQRPRCWYFRNARFRCWLKGGEECFAAEGENALHALFGGGPCVAVHPSDLAPALLALEASVQLRGVRGERWLPLEAFFALPTEERRQETRIRPDELLVAVRLPPLPEGTRSLYLKAMDRKVWAFALVGVAARARVAADGRIEEARLVLGGVAPVPWRCGAAEAMLVGETASETLWERAAEAALAEARPLRENGYKVPLARALIRRALAGVASAAA